MHTKNLQLYAKVTENYKLLVTLRAKLPKAQEHSSKEEKGTTGEKVAAGEREDDDDDEEEDHVRTLCPFVALSMLTAHSNEQNAELDELRSHSSDGHLRRLVYLKGALGVGPELADLVERLESFLERERYLSKPTVCGRRGERVDLIFLRLAG